MISPGILPNGPDTESETEELDTVEVEEAQLLTREAKRGQ